MAKEKTHEALVRTPAPGEDAEPNGESSLYRVSVSEGDMPDPEPSHAGPEKLGLANDPFDPNAARRNKLGLAPGLQDSEAKNPAVWVDERSEDARKSAADAHVQDAERKLAAAKERAKAIRKGDPIDQEVR
jgi:hypothetical protein